jgi:SAM-dependent methyltransferase
MKSKPQARGGDNATRKNNMSTVKSNRDVMDASFFAEYTSHDAILKYTRATAGHGISYLLDHDYKDIYLKALDLLPAAVKARGLRILEFGCGGGMNLVHLVSVLKQAGIKVNQAVGTDFSPVLIEAAKREAGSYLMPEDQGKLAFHVAKNESLIQDMAAANGVDRSQILNSFDFIIGVNTIRYCHRFGREMDCARDIYQLLAPGGVCVNIDMNDRFPAFRSDLKNMLRSTKEEECYIPSLREYAAPFEKTGFEMIRKENFCWIPHSGSKFMCAIMGGLTPILNTVARARAMRSLVVVRKPAGASK